MKAHSNRGRTWRRLAALLVVTALVPFDAAACSVCFGEPGSAMSRGLFWGVIALLSVVMSVLGLITAFFVYIARRSARLGAGTDEVALGAGGSTAKV